MNIINELLSQYSLGELIILILSCGFGGKFVWDILSFYYDKIKEHFDILTEKDRAEKELYKSVQRFDSYLDSFQKQLDAIDDRTRIIQERMQNDTRAYIIDKHHYYVYDMEFIDDLGLQDLERRYHFYKDAGGDTFVDQLMQEVRCLPRITLRNLPNSDRG